MELKSVEEIEAVLDEAHSELRQSKIANAIRLIIAANRAQLAYQSANEGGSNNDAR